MAKLIVRIDDIHEYMNWENFQILVEYLRKRNLTALLGVIPKCSDPKLIMSTVKADFWSEIKALQVDGFTIAQHGFEHLYNSFGSTIMFGHHRSEFAGLSYDEQLNKIYTGKKLLEERGLFTETFMAPGHSYDTITLQCLRDLGYKYITDGHEFWPYESNGLICVPQLFSAPHGLPVGVYTTCFHLDRLKQSDIWRLCEKLDRHEIISFTDATKFSRPKIFSHKASHGLAKILVKSYRKLSQISRKS